MHALRPFVALAVIAGVAGATPMPIYPTPPQQTAAWSPPATKLAEPVVTAARKLFDAGLADPRGLPYREIEIEVGEAWAGAASVAKTHGWVLRGDAYAIAWNGLVYPVRSVGAPADAVADVKTALDADDAARAKSEREHPNSGGSFHRFPTTAEAYYVATESIAPLKTILLLRLGEGELAERAWKAAVDRADDPFELVLEDWLWAQFERGITAHMRGDVALAVESWRRLPALAKLASHAQGGRDFLQNIDALLADEQRRAAHPHSPIDLAALKSRPQAERVTKLVAALEDVQARQWGQPGGVSLGEDPIVQALVEEGDAAVDALLAAYEKDERRTRSVQFWRDFARHRDVLTVYEAAYVALAGVLDMSFFEPASTGDNLTARGADGRKKLGEQLRAYWKKWRAVPREERAYRMLADDASGIDKWFAAASQIVQPTNVRVIPSSSIGHHTVTQPTPPGQQPKLRGEALRDKRSPSVSELFARRLPAMPSFGARAQWLGAFATWDAPAARPHLVTAARDGIAAWATSSNKPYDGVAIARLTHMRVDAGDTDALAEYAKWIVATDPSVGDYQARAWLAPMLEHTDAPEIVAASGKMFAGKSPWTQLTSKQNGYHLGELIGSDLVKLAAFRKHVVAQLGNRAKHGTLTVHDGNVQVQTDGSTTSYRVDANDTLAPTADLSFDLRVADQYAMRLAERQGAPKYKPYWPPKVRDQAIADLVAWLNAM